MLAPDTILGKYKVLRLLGNGGMADVYEAEDQQLGRRVAIKVLPAEFARDPKAVLRFEKEVRAAASLNHANIVTIFEVDHARGLHFCAMRLLTGGDLRARIDKGLNPAQALEITREIASAFAHAHGVGFVHRDVKPENILFDEQGRAILTDFGIAKAMTSDLKMTATGVSIGTPRYISPEQARGQTVDGRADIYSLGVILYEMLTGKLPYLAEDSLALIFMHVTEPIPRLPAALSRFQGLIDALMAKDPAQRPASADEVLKMLRAFTEVAPPPPPPPPPPRPSAGSNATIVTGEREFAQKLVAEEERQRADATRRSGQLGKEVIAAAAAAAPPEPPPPPPPPPPPKPAAPPPRSAAASVSRSLPTASFDRPKLSNKAPLAIIGGVGLVVIGLALGAMLIGGDDGDEAAVEEAVAEETIVEPVPDERPAPKAATPAPKPVAVAAAAAGSIDKAATPAPTPASVMVVGTAPPSDAKAMSEAEKKRKAALDAKRSSAANQSKTAVVDNSSQQEIDRTKRFAREKAGCKRHVSELFPGWEFTYADMAKYPGARKSADGSLETPELSDDYGNPKRYIIDASGCIVGMID